MDVFSILLKQVAFSFLSVTSGFDYRSIIYVLIHFYKTKITFSESIYFVSFKWFTLSLTEINFRYESCGIGTVNLLYNLLEARMLMKANIHGL